MRRVLASAPRRRRRALLKLVAPLAHPAEVMVLLDADLIVTRPLTELIDDRRARARWSRFANDRQRHFPEWAELLELGAGPRRPLPHLERARPSVRERRAGARADRRAPARGRSSSGPGSPAAPTAIPLYYLDQDVLNAVVALAARRRRARRARRAPGPDPALRRGPPRRRRGACAAPTATAPSPTCSTTPPASRGWSAMRSNVYSRLLTRLLLGAGRRAAARPRASCPRRLRTGPRPAASAARHRPACSAPRASCGGCARRPAPVPAWPDSAAP